MFNLKKDQFFKPKKILFFTGPSCPAELIYQKIPNADVRPPAKRGDLLKAVKEKFHVVGLIDGTMIEVPTIGSHEIFYALDHGVHLYGSSSLGALRAVEFRNHGFQGIGVIYQWYLQQVTYRDDELLVQMNDDTSESLTEPLVNLRFVLLCALQKKIIPLRFAKMVLAEYSKLYYLDRHIDIYFTRKMTTADDETKKNLKSLIQFRKKLKEKANLKQLDALQMVEQIKNTYAY